MMFVTYALAALSAPIAVAFGDEDVITGPQQIMKLRSSSSASSSLTPKEDHTNNADEYRRNLQDECATPIGWHPDYSNGWDQGKCDYTTTCNSPSYSTNLACCKGAFGGQWSKYCISQMANPPTLSPTKTGGPDEYYPDYSLPWTEGICTNSQPIPSGRPVYTTMLACCKAAYAGQASKVCIKSLPTPPTMAPTKTGSGGTDYYPDYSLDWSVGICINTQPAPSGIPVYATMLACCKAAYAGQASKVCIKSLPNPPTMAPTKTGSGGTDYYPDYSLDWSVGICINTQPSPSGVPVYATMLACCKAAYAGQASKVCIKSLPNPPTMAPTKTGSEGTDYYPDYSRDWSNGLCINTQPAPSGIPVYATMLACCKAAYAGQMSKFCIKSLPNPPTSSPTRKRV